MSGHRHLLLPVLTALALLSTACNSVGPPSVRQAPFAYNQALSGAANEQLLLNLVRLKYRDTPYFLQPTSVSTQYSLSGSLGASVDVTTDGDASGSSGTGFSLSETPTVTWNPLQGERFVTELLSPISIDALMLLPQAGWSVERVLRLTVQRIDDLPNAPSLSGPTPGYRPESEAFERLACALRMLQVEGRLRVKVHEIEKPAAEGEEPETRLQFRVALVEKGWREPPTAEVCAWAQTVDAETRERFDPEAVLESFGVVLPGVGAVLRNAYVEEDDAFTLSLEPRSLLGVLYYLSEAVETPTEHAGRVTHAGGCGRPRFSGGEPPQAPWWLDFNHDLFRVECSKRRPPRSETFVEVHYQGYWFFVRQSDLSSKSTFNLLTQLFSLQAGGSEGITPTLTLDLGG